MNCVMNGARYVLWVIPIVCLPAGITENRRAEEIWTRDEWLRKKDNSCD